MVPERKLINELEEIIYVSDPDTYEIYYVNEVGRKTMGFDEYKGEKCYELIQGLSSPCEFCTNSKLKKNEFYIWEHTNLLIDQHFILKDKLIDWNGKDARFEIAINITEKENISAAIQNKLQIANVLIDCIRLLTSAKTLEEAIDAVLASIGSFYQADRTYILELDEDTPTTSNTFEWCREGIESQMHTLQKIPLEATPNWVRAMETEGQYFIKNIEDIRDIHPEEYDILKNRISIL